MNRVIMDNSGHNFSSSFWFNSNLFNTNGVPLKFYLDGYDLHEFTAIVKIIEAYGGKLSEPDDPDTIIFCEAGVTVSTDKYQYYDIKYFHDSIVGLQPQELMDYKLGENTNQRLENLKDHNESIKSFGNEENKFDPSMITDTSTIQNGLEDSENLSDNLTPRVPTCAKKCFVKLERFEISDEDNENFCPEIQEQYESLNDEDELSDDSGVSQTSDDSNHSQADDTILSNRRHSSTARVTDKSGKRKDRAPRVRTDKRKKKRSTPKNTSWTFKEQQSLIQYLIDNDLIHRANSRKTWVEYIEKHGPLDPRRTVESLRCRYRNYLSHDYAKYINDPEALKKFEEIEEQWHADYKKQGKSSAWTKAEDRTLVQYLIDADAISRANTTKVWIKCLETCRSSLHPSRTARSLLTRFRYTLQKTYPMFTNDPDALMKFKQLKARPSISNKNYWTDEENKILIQFIIEKNAAYDARLYSFWEDNLAELQSNYRINRTANAIRYQYYKELRYNYEKYTDDQQACRQFKEVLSRIQEKNLFDTNDLN